MHASHSNLPSRVYPKHQIRANSSEIPSSLDQANSSMDVERSQFDKKQPRPAMPSGTVRARRVVSYASS